MGHGIEIEAKFPVPDFEPVRQRLRAAGATPAGAALETNRFFDSADGRLRAGGCGLRVRGLRVLDGPPRQATITFKGPVRPGALKVRPEHEVEVADAEAAAMLLTQLGFVEFFSFEKRRETWRLGDCLVELDELPYLGRFIEIEGPSEAAVRAAQSAIGCAEAAIERASYLGLLIRVCEQRGITSRALRLEGPSA